ncbi:MAG: hypothetical protein AB1489_37655 [Acidobacteriota bacterium]
MRNKSKHKLNQPPTGEGKKQSPYSGEANKLNKRSEVLQAQHNRPEENIDLSENDETFYLPNEWVNPKRQKAGR